MQKLNTFILRYSDFEDANINTINEHIGLLQKNDYVLWGWFKKPYESLSIRSHGEECTYYKYNKSYGSLCLPNELLLFNSSKREVYKAHCRRIITQQTIIPEEKEAIPAYYRKIALEYWFCLTSFSKVEYNEFHKSFCDSINFSSDDTVLTNKVSVKNSLIQVKANGILHISDLHFGTAFNYCMDNEVHRAYPKLLDKFSVISKKHQDSVGIIVASGDFSFGGDDRTKNFNAARSFLVDLCDLFQLDYKKHLIVVPGNHDKGFVEDTPKEHITSSFEEKVLNNYDIEYREFKKSLTDDEQITYIRKYLLPNETKINLAALDSSDLQSKKKREYGYIDLRQLDIIKSFDIDENDLNMAVFHHPLVLPPTIYSIFSYEDKTGKFHSSPLSILENAYEIAQELTYHRFKYILHGHQHYPYFGKYIMHNKNGNTNIGFLSAGSLGLNTTNQHSDFPYNSFNIYKIDKNKIDIEAYRFLQRDPPEMFDSCRFRNHQLKK